jgi:hypothetical protein
VDVNTDGKAAAQMGDDRFQLDPNAKFDDEIARLSRENNADIAFRLVPREDRAMDGNCCIHTAEHMREAQPAQVLVYDYPDFGIRNEELGGLCPYHATAAKSGEWDKLCRDADIAKVNRLAELAKRSDVNLRIVPKRPAPNAEIELNKATGPMNLRDGPSHPVPPPPTQDWKAESPEPPKPRTITLEPTPPPPPPPPSPDPDWNRLVQFGSCVRRSVYAFQLVEEFLGPQVVHREGILVFSADGNAALQVLGVMPPSDKRGRHTRPPPWVIDRARRDPGRCDVITPVVIALSLLTAILFGSKERVERVLRLLRWIANRPEPAVPAPPGPGRAVRLLPDRVITRCITRSSRARPGPVRSCGRHW